jgi:hypothetical protein
MMLQHKRREIERKRIGNREGIVPVESSLPRPQIVVRQ